MTRSAITGSTARNLAQDSRHNASDRGPIRIGVTTEQVRDEWIEFDAQASDPGYGVTKGPVSVKSNTVCRAVSHATQGRIGRGGSISGRRM